MSGDIPLMGVDTTNLEGGRHVDITAVVEGDAPISGTFRISFRGAVSEPIDASLNPDDLAEVVATSLEALDTIESGGISAFEVSISNGGQEKILLIEFHGDGVGGDVAPIKIDQTENRVHGTSADVFVVSDGEGYTARNGIDQFFSRVGNVLSGHFRLKLRGHTTERIPFNASADQMKARLEALANVGTINVEVSAATNELGYSWTITFISNPGYFPPSTRDVDLLQYINSMNTSVDNDASADIRVD
eukprot:1537287-Ditylum_brightwellii.AAC.1